MTIYWILLASVIVGELVLAFGFSWLRRRGSVGEAMVNACCRAPLLDVVFAVMTWIPWIVGGIIAGWGGVGVVIGGQILSVLIWIRLHEFIHREAARGPRLLKAHNKLVGKWRNHGALWFCVLALPMFWALRIGEILLYPPLRWMLVFPKYRQGEWVNVSRMKFDGLVGHDLIWCLYCDWMTGLYSLGAEMLRNVESFWCPIRFYDGNKCENCTVDFPDIADGWVAADGSMEEVVELVEDRYNQTPRGWFKHPARLTVEGEPVDETPSPSTDESSPS